MPVLTVEIPDVGATIHRQVIEGVVRNTLRQMGCKDEDIFYVGAYSNVAQPQSNIGEERTLNFGNTDKIVVEVDEVRDPEGLNDRYVGRVNQPPIFKNNFFNISILPELCRYNVSVTITRRAASRPIISNWANELRRKFSMGRDIIETQSSYHYLIPVPALNLIADIHRAMITKIDDKFPLLDLLVNGFNKGVTVISNQSGDYKQYAVRNTLTRILSVFDPSEEIEQEKHQNGNGAWTGRFRFNFQYERPESVTCYYPIMINNTLLPEQWWQPRQMPGIADMIGTVRSVYIDAQDTVRDMLPFINLPIFLPECDSPDLPHMGYDPKEIDLLAGYLELSPEEINPLIPLFNLTELGNVSLTPAVLNYLKDAYLDANDGSNSILRVMIFEDRHKLDPHQVQVDQQLRVWGNFTGKITSLYRFALTTRRDWSLIPEEAIDILRHHPVFVWEWLKDFHPDLLDGHKAIGDIAKGITDGSLPSDTPIEWEDIDHLTDALSDTDHPELIRYYGSDAVQYYTVLNGRIIAHRSN